MTLHMLLHITDETCVKIWDVIEEDDYIFKISDVGHTDKAEETNTEPGISRNSVIVALFLCYPEYIPILSLHIL